MADQFVGRALSFGDLHNNDQIIEHIAYFLSHLVPKAAASLNNANAGAFPPRRTEPDGLLVGLGF